MSEPDAPVREFLGEVVIYGFKHQVFSWFSQLPEMEQEYDDEETGETVRFMVPPTTRLEIEFTSLPLSHSTGYTAAVPTLAWDMGYDELRRSLWRGTAMSAWEEVHEKLADHPLLAVRDQVRAFQSSRLGRALKGDPDALAEMVNDGPLDE
ncbi:hypothetical protein TPA2_gp74 [Tsukamurella phage TPA2]|uniref:hypothetical protein n=1 Tax=Tsukamurella phage TPA2 TaxID=981330 RepID=UPI0001FF8DE1|nr:hypothetical protein TPA2_gp74 [Tsukamurella phage TPA2]ADX31988.1 hypothetical protein [Tsukamurella phage TPA2]